MRGFDAGDLPWIGVSMLEDALPDKLHALDVYRRHIKNVIEDNNTDGDSELTELLEMDLGGGSSSRSAETLCPETIMAMRQCLELLDSLSGYLK